MQATPIHKDHFSLKGIALRRAAWKAAGNRGLKRIDKLYYYDRYINLVWNRRKQIRTDTSETHAEQLNKMVNDDLQIGPAVNA